MGPIKVNVLAHLPVLQEIAGAKAVVGKFLQSHTRSGVVEDVDHEVAQGKGSPNNAENL